MNDSYSLKFIWQEADGRLRVVYCDENDVPIDTGLGKYIDAWIQWKFNEISNIYQFLEEYAASVTLNTQQCVQIPRGRFLYMDVGRWLNEKQSFGVVCHDDAVLCDYNPGAGGTGCELTTSSLINEVLGIPGVSVRSWKKIIGPHPPDADHVMIILPDMHVPEAPPLEMKPPTRNWNRPLGALGNWRVDPEAFARATKMDFFSSRSSIQAMITFLKALREKLTSNVALVQIGDIYELWAGHPLEYVQTRAAVVELAHKYSATSVGAWIGTIHDMQDDLFEQFDLCGETMLTIYIHGNHDSYLSRPDVIKAANDYIEMAYSTKDEFGYERQWFKKTTVPPRIASINFQGVFLEHGQRVDGPNRDGSTEGWEKTNQAFDVFGTAKRTPGDTTRRQSFVTGAAAHWVANNKDFGLYVMGHTHDPELKYVEVVHQRGSISYSGGKVLVQTTGAF